MATKRSAKSKSAPSRLRTYAKKRDFSVTSEPKPAPIRKRAGDALTFMVHKHDARRLHYDLRLEIDGVLASWAVPKGPSFDPSVKRLAVETEDHPFEYGSFEGDIPEGAYGAGLSLIWDRGTYETDPPGQASVQRKNGHLKIRLAGEKLEGGWHLVRTRSAGGGKSSWLLFKARDEAADPDFDVVVEKPESVVSGRDIENGSAGRRISSRKTRQAGAVREPTANPGPKSGTPAGSMQRRRAKSNAPPLMLATLVKGMEASALDPKEWSFEIKYDGFRALGTLGSGRTALRSRNGEDLAQRFPDIATSLGRISASDAVIDGEIAALDAKRISRFGLLQQGGARTFYFCFDLLQLDGRDLRNEPLEARRKLLEKLLSRAKAPLALSEIVEGSPVRALERVAAAGGEGLIAKRRGSIYRLGRSKDWLKLKTALGQELAIVGYTPEKNGRGMGALLLAVADTGRLVYAGKVGTGFSAADRRELAALLDKDGVARPEAEGAPRIRIARWVRPKRVAQVKFTEWTSDGRLRHPVFVGLREDKTPLECVREVPASIGREN